MALVDTEPGIGIDVMTVSHATPPSSRSASTSTSANASRHSKAPLVTARSPAPGLRRKPPRRPPEPASAAVRATGCAPRTDRTASPSTAPWSRPPSCRPIPMTRTRSTSLPGPRPAAESTIAPSGARHPARPARRDPRRGPPARRSTSRWTRRSTPTCSSRASSSSRSRSGSWPYGDSVDFVGWIAGMELDEIISLTVGDVVTFVAEQA